ncbi:MAG: hypothetical protein UT55_C0008G0010 [Candidatus Peregrinibacteria bacterium GW2011_GWE2_39_6]|nr:MAG: hypothetical protein UT36_C0002G0066 [Candidatus Peregrinibacteria bacterium GW2011_GWF2_39_17]KKR26419.1 MAG: hypothetical protein UT55_C0008G0010 [Candidatus Peregrinibacteria bacterium GW2011_GWE2_39_6]HCW32170.1 hypothetical protein [Candidatus Peregrinibacteria bacterium]
MKNRFFLWLLVFLVIFTLMQRLGKPAESPTTFGDSNLGMVTQKTEYQLGKEIILTMQNNTDSVLTLPSDCPDEPLLVEFYSNGDWVEITARDEIDCPAVLSFEIQPRQDVKISYKDWAYRVFGEIGRYRIGVNATINGETKIFYSNDFSVISRGFLNNAWLNFIYRPILNTLVFLIEILPGHSLGLAIILLTLIIRTLLLLPSQRAMRSQKKMQEIQSKIEEIKKKHKNNQERLAMETVNLWKTHKVNPFGSCLLMFIQFPILIALYYVVKEGLNPDKAILLYGQIASLFSFSGISTNFLGILELTEVNFFILPLIVGGLQFVQMHLALSRKGKKSESHAQKKDKTLVQKAQGSQDMQDQMAMANNMMKYFMPVMIAFFTASLPAGVGLYWGVSTSYGILQQFVINRESSREADLDEPMVRVIDKKKP